MSILWLHLEFKFSWDWDCWEINGNIFICLRKFDILDTLKIKVYVAYWFYECNIL